MRGFFPCPAGHSSCRNMILISSRITVNKKDKKGTNIFSSKKFSYELSICSSHGLVMQFLQDSFSLSAISLGSITSRCSGKEPALLPRTHGWTREDSFVSLSQSDIRPQIFVGHKLSHQFGLRVGSISDALSCVRSTFLPEKRRLDA